MQRQSSIKEILLGSNNIAKQTLLKSPNSYLSAQKKLSEGLDEQKKGGIFKIDIESRSVERQDESHIDPNSTLATQPSKLKQTLVQTILNVNRLQTTQRRGLLSNQTHSTSQQILNSKQFVVNPNTITEEQDQEHILAAKSQLNKPLKPSQFEKRKIQNLKEPKKYNERSINRNGSQQTFQRISLAGISYGSARDSSNRNNSLQKDSFSASQILPSLRDKSQQKMMQKHVKSTAQINHFLNQAVSGKEQKQRQNYVSTIQSPLNYQIGFDKNQKDQIQKFGSTLNAQSVQNGLHSSLEEVNQNKNFQINKASDFSNIPQIEKIAHSNQNTKSQRFEKDQSNHQSVKQILQASKKQYVSSQRVSINDQSNLQKHKKEILQKASQQIPKAVTSLKSYEISQGKQKLLSLQDFSKGDLNQAQFKILESFGTPILHQANRSEQTTEVRVSEASILMNKNSQNRIFGAQEKQEGLQFKIQSQANTVERKDNNESQQSTSALQIKSLSIKHGKIQGEKLVKQPIQSKMNFNDWATLGQNIYQETIIPPSPGGSTFLNTKPKFQKMKKIKSHKNPSTQAIKRQFATVEEHDTEKGHLEEIRHNLGQIVKIPNIQNSRDLVVPQKQSSRLVKGLERLTQRSQGEESNQFCLDSKQIYDNSKSLRGTFLVQKPLKQNFQKQFSPDKFKNKAYKRGNLELQNQKETFQINIGSQTVKNNQNQTASIDLNWIPITNTEEMRLLAKSGRVSQLSADFGKDKNKNLNQNDFSNSQIDDNMKKLSIKETYQVSQIPQKHIVTQSKSFLSPQNFTKDQLNAENYLRHLDTQIENNQTQFLVQNFGKSQAQTEFLSEKVKQEEQSLKKLHESSQRTQTTLLNLAQANNIAFPKNSLPDETKDKIIVKFGSRQKQSNEIKKSLNTKDQTALIVKRESIKVQTDLTKDRDKFKQDTSSIQIISPRQQLETQISQQKKKKIKDLPVSVKDEEVKLDKMLGQEEQNVSRRKKSQRKIEFGQKLTIQDQKLATKKSRKTQNSNTDDQNYLSSPNFKRQKEKLNQANIKKGSSFQIQSPREQELGLQKLSKKQSKGNQKTKTQTFQGKTQSNSSCKQNSQTIRTSTKDQKSSLQNQSDCTNEIETTSFNQALQNQESLKISSQDIQSSENFAQNQFQFNLDLNQNLQRQLLGNKKATSHFGEQSPNQNLSNDEPQRQQPNTPNLINQATDQGEQLFDKRLSDKNKVEFQNDSFSIQQDKFLTPGRENETYQQPIISQNKQILAQLALQKQGSSLDRRNNRINKDVNLALFSLKNENQILDQESLGYEQRSCGFQIRQLKSIQLNDPISKFAGKSGKSLDSVQNMSSIQQRNDQDNSTMQIQSGSGTLPMLGELQEIELNNGSTRQTRHQVSPCSRNEFVKDVHTKLLLQNFNSIYGTELKSDNQFDQQIKGTQKSDAESDREHQLSFTFEMLNKLDIPKNLHGQVADLPIKVLSDSIDLYQEIRLKGQSTIQFKPIKEFLSLKRNQFEILNQQENKCQNMLKSEMSTSQQSLDSPRILGISGKINLNIYEDETQKASVNHNLANVTFYQSQTDPIQQLYEKFSVSENSPIVLLPSFSDPHISGMLKLEFSHQTLPFIPQMKTLYTFLEKQKEEEEKEDDPSLEYYQL